MSAARERVPANRGGVRVFEARDVGDAAAPAVVIAIDPNEPQRGYVVTHYRGEWLCSCFVWRYRRGCVHVEAVRAWQAAPASGTG